MKAHAFFRLADHELLRVLAEILHRERATTAELLACLAEVDERRLYAAAGYPSLHGYCVGELHMSGDAAAKRIQAARVARRFPAILPALAEGRLHLSAVVLLAPHLQPGNVDGLIAAATHQTYDEIRLLLSQRFPAPDVPTLIEPLAQAGEREHAAQHVADEESQRVAPALCDSGISRAPQHVEPAATHARLAPLSPGRFALQVTIPQATHEKLRYAQELLGHAVPAGDLSQLLECALDALIAQLEKRRLGAVSRSSVDHSKRELRSRNDSRCAPAPVRRQARGSACNGRYVPAEVRREVWQRDRGRCTFVSDRGHRCEARTRLEFDHIEPLARGGHATTANLRLRCRAHNQLAAECAFGRGFMERKREEARREAAAKRERAQARARVAAPADRLVEAKAGRADVAAAAAARAEQRAARDALRAAAEEVVPYLRTLGCRPDEARRHAAAAAEAAPAAPLEERVRFALKRLAPPGARRLIPVASSPA